MGIDACHQLQKDMGEAAFMSRYARGGLVTDIKLGTRAAKFVMPSGKSEAALHSGFAEASS